MINREKVIRHIIAEISIAKTCKKDFASVDIDMLSDALALLKEQEPKTGYWVSINDGDIVTIDNDGFPERACFCSECKKYLIASDEYGVYGRYCPFCGAKMEGRWNRDDSD